jgi:hypothetical protein
MAHPVDYVSFTLGLHVNQHIRITPHVISRDPTVVPLAPPPLSFGYLEPYSKLPPHVPGTRRRPYQSLREPLFAPSRDHAGTKVACFIGKCKWRCEVGGMSSPGCVAAAGTRMSMWCLGCVVMIGLGQREEGSFKNPHLALSLMCM